MCGFEINGPKPTSGTETVYTRQTSNVYKQKEVLFNYGTAPSGESFYPELNLSPEARMLTEMRNSSFIQGLNELFGIN